MAAEFNGGVIIAADSRTTTGYFRMFDIYVILLIQIITEPILLTVFLIN